MGVMILEMTISSSCMLRRPMPTDDEMSIQLDDMVFSGDLRFDVSRTSCYLRTSHYVDERVEQAEDEDECLQEVSLLESRRKATDAMPRAEWRRKTGRNFPFTAYNKRLS